MNFHIFTFINIQYLHVYRFYAYYIFSDAMYIVHLLSDPFIHGNQHCPMQSLLQSVSSVFFLYSAKQKVSFVFRSTKDLQKMLLGKLSFLHTLFLKNEEQTSEKIYRAMFVD